MYNPIIHKDGLQLGTSRSLPRHFTTSGNKSSASSKVRARSKSPGRPQLALVLCPDYQGECVAFWIIKSNEGLDR